MSEDRCVCCGAIIPEGRQVCPTCEKANGAIVKVETCFCDADGMPKNQLSAACLNGSRLPIARNGARHIAAQSIPRSHGVSE